MHMVRHLQLVVHWVSSFSTFSFGVSTHPLLSQLFFEELFLSAPSYVWPEEGDEKH